MNEITFYMLVLIGWFAMTTFPFVIKETACKRKFKRNLQQVKKTYSKMKKVQEQALFVALASAYEKK